VYAIDASVFLNAFNPAEPGHAESRDLLARLLADGTPVAVPTLVLPEVAGAISRVHGDGRLAREFSGELAQLPNLILVPLDAALAHQARDLAADHRLRGADAVYAAVASRFGAILVTLDREQRDRLSTALVTRSPTEVL
jgi:predicted nucleic acid-binding protein